MKLNYILIFLKIYNLFCYDLFNDTFINNDNNSIDNAVYIIKTREGDLNLEISNYKYLEMNNNTRIKTTFLVKKEQDINLNIVYFYIEYKPLKKCISIKKNEANEEIILESCDNKLNLWRIIPKINSNNQLVYYVQNKFNQKFWEFNNISNTKNIILSNTTNFYNLTFKNEFQFVNMYRELDKFESQILKNEPIDVLITYVDLNDKHYISKIPRIKKEKDNNELKYSLRSILQNIPWIRKIFILMPNEKVSFLKPIKEINEKIVYVKDKDYLGFESNSSPTIQFNLHKMKKFNISENFILMDDDNFIAQPLEKSDFFYEEKGEVYPCLISSKYYEMNKEKLEKSLLELLTKYDAKIAHSESFFLVQVVKSLLLMYNIFGEDKQRNGKKLIEPVLTHNAIPVKLSDIEELYELINKYYNFANETLAGLSRSINTLQMQTAYTAYVKNKYNRKVNKISYIYYDLTQYFDIYNNTKKLFVINTGLKNYSTINFQNETKVMNYLFPNKTKYELNDFYMENTNNNMISLFCLVLVIFLKFLIKKKKKCLLNAIKL